MIKGINYTIVGFNVVVSDSDSESFIDAEKKIIDCISFLNGKTCEELKECPESYYKEFADKSSFKKHGFTLVTQEQLSAHPDCGEELSDLSFIIEGELKAEEKYLDWNDIGAESFISDLTKLLYTVSGVPLGIHFVAFPSAGMKEWANSMFSYIDGSTFRITDLWDGDYCFDYTVDDDVIFEVITREEFVKNNEAVHNRILKNLRNPEKSYFYSKDVKMGQCKKIGSGIREND